MRLLSLFESTPTHLTKSMIGQIRQWRHECRVSNGGGGMCHEVSEIIEGEWDWERVGGTYCHSDGSVICSAHYWNIMPDGSIIDGTADQLGEDDIRIVKPTDPEFKQYRPEYYDDYHPGHPQFDKDYPGHNLTWDGRGDYEAQIADDRPAGWEHTDVRKLKILRKYLIDRRELEINDPHSNSDGERTRKYIQQVDARIAQLQESLTESSTQYLYHGTDMIALAEIVSSNELRKGWHRGNPNEPHGISLTRSPKIAKLFQNPGDDDLTGGTIVFERSVLDKQFNLVHYDDQVGANWAQGSEQEEVVETDVIKPVDRYIHSIICSGNRIQLVLREAAFYARQLEMETEALTEMLWVLYKHPKRVDK